MVRGDFGSFVLDIDKTYLSSLVGQTVLFSIVTICATQIVRSQLTSSSPFLII